MTIKELIEIRDRNNRFVDIEQSVNPHEYSHPLYEATRHLFSYIRSYLETDIPQEVENEVHKIEKEITEGWKQR